MFLAPFQVKAWQGEGEEGDEEKRRRKERKRRRKRRKRGQEKKERGKEDRVWGGEGREEGQKGRQEEGGVWGGVLATCPAVLCSVACPGWAPGASVPGVGRGWPGSLIAPVEAPLAHLRKPRVPVHPGPLPLGLLRKALPHPCQQPMVFSVSCRGS